MSRNAGPYSYLVCGFSLMSVLWLIGCTGSTVNGPTADGLTVLLDAEPADSMGVVDLKSSMITGIAPTDDSALLVGRVVGDQDWEPDQATFLIRDIQAEPPGVHDHGDGDHSDCAFCQAKKDKDLESMALVRVVDGSGQTFSSDARKLLGLEENVVVVAQGGGTIEEDGTLVFSASKIFIRP